MFLRHRQPIVTRVTPHNGNRRYAIPNGGRTKGAPVPALEAFEWEARQNPTGWMTVPVTANIDLGFTLSFRCRVRVLNGDCVMAHNNQFTFKTSLSGNQSAQLVIGATTINCTMPPVLPGVWVDYKLIFAPGDIDGTAIVIADGVKVGQGTYALGTGASFPLYMLNAGTGAPAASFQGVIEDIRYNDTDFWEVNDGSGTVVKDTGLNPSGNAGVFNNAGLSNWFPGTCGVKAWRYYFSAANTLEGIDIDLERAIPDQALNTTGLVLTKTPGAVNLPPLTATLINNNSTLRVTFAPFVAVSGDRIQWNLTRTGASLLPVCSTNYTLPNALLMVLPS